ncbi:MAG: hypothetical protein AAF458_05490 [Pseudomonadota bacterium]
MGFAHPSSIQAEEWLNIEHAYPDRQGRVRGLTANPDHECSYLARMTPAEAAIFHFDGNRGQPAIRHGALDMPDGNF